MAAFDRPSQWQILLQIGDLAVRLVMLGFSMGSDHGLLRNAKIAELLGTLSDF
jgi:hypothetical protein